MTKQYIITTFYKFIPLINHETLKTPLLAAMQQYNILGTIIIAQEGINGGIAGTHSNMHEFYSYMRQDANFTDLYFKETYDDLMPYEKAKVKFRKEIVTLGVADIDPIKETGVRLSPKEWNLLISDPEVIVIDTRNNYEVTHGTFKNAIDPNTENFRDLPKYVEENLLDKKDKKIAMFCTGGIRCEKSTAYLKTLGFKQVYQLEGGIIDYVKNTPAADSLWQGQCFVFDERIAI